MIVYRIEHEVFARGPYTGHDAVWSIIGAHEDEFHPAPHEDTEEVANFAERNFCIFGLSSREAVYEWFKGFFSELALYDFKLKTYEVPEGFYAAGKQVVFKDHGYTLLSVEDLDEFITKDKETIIT